MSSQKDVQHSIAKWISALKNVPRGNPHKTIRELSNVQHHQLQSIKALCRHQLDMSTTQKREAVKLLQEWMDAPPSIEYHRACVELCIHLEGLNKSTEKHIENQITKISWENKDDLDYLRDFTIHKRGDPMDLYWLCLIGSKEQQQAIGEAIRYMTLSHPWLRLLRSLVGLVENGHCFSLYGVLVYLCFETASSSRFPESDSFGWSIETAIKIRRRLTRVAGNKEALLLSLLEHMPAYPLVPPFPIAKRMMGIGVYVEPRSERMLQKGNENVIWSICEKEADAKSLFVPTTTVFSKAIFEQCLKVLRGNAHSQFAFFAARYLLQDPSSLKKVDDWENLVRRYPELLPAAASLWMNNPTREQKNIIEENLLLLGKQGAGALLLARQWISKHGGSHATLIKGAFAVDALYDIGTLSILVEMTSSKVVAEGIAKRVIWSTYRLEAKWDARWLSFLEGIQIDSHLLLHLTRFSFCYEFRAFKESVLYPYLISVLPSWKGAPLPEFSFQLLRAIHYGANVAKVAKLKDVAENWLLQFVPSSKDDEETQYLYWMTILASKMDFIELDLPNLEKKLRGKKRDLNKYLPLATLRFTGNNTVSEEDEWYEESLKMSIRYGYYEEEALDSDYYDYNTWKNELEAGAFFAVYTYFQTTHNDEDKRKILSFILDSYPEHISSLINDIHELDLSKNQIENIFRSLPPYSQSLEYFWNNEESHVHPSLDYIHKIIRSNTPKRVAKSIPEYLQKREEPALLHYLFAKAIEHNTISTKLQSNWNFRIENEALNYLVRSIGRFFVSQIPFLLRTKRIDTPFWREVLSILDKRLLGQSYLLSDMYVQYPHMKRSLLSAALFAENESLYDILATDLKQCIEEKNYVDFECIVGKNKLIQRFFRENPSLEAKIASLDLFDSNSNNPLLSLRIAYEMQKDRTVQEVISLISPQGYTSEILQAYYVSHSSEAQALVFSALRQNMDNDSLQSIVVESLPYLRKLSTQEESVIFGYWSKPEQHFSSLIDLMLMCSAPWQVASRLENIFSFVVEHSRWDTIGRINTDTEYWYRLACDYLSRPDVNHWDTENILKPFQYETSLENPERFWSQMWSKDKAFTARFLNVIISKRYLYEHGRQCVITILSCASIEELMAYPDVFYSLLFVDDDSINREARALWMDKFVSERNNGYALFMELLDRIAQNEISSDIFAEDWGWTKQAMERAKTLFRNNSSVLYAKIPSLIETFNQYSIIDFTAEQEIWEYRTILYPVLSGYSEEKLIPFWQNIFQKDRKDQKLGIFLQEYLQVERQYHGSFFCILENVSDSTIYQILKRYELILPFCSAACSSGNTEHPVLTRIKNDRQHTHIFYQTYLLTNHLSYWNLDTEMVSSKFADYESLTTSHPIEFFAKLKDWIQYRASQKHDWFRKCIIHFFTFCIQTDPVYMAEHCLSAEEIAQQVQYSQTSAHTSFSIHLLFYALKNNRFIELVPWMPFVEQIYLDDNTPHDLLLEILSAFARIEVAPEEQDTLNKLRTNIIPKIPCTFFESNVCTLLLPIWDNLEHYRDALLKPENSITNTLGSHILSLPNRNIHAIDFYGSLCSTTMESHNSPKIIHPPAGLEDSYHHSEEATPFPIRIDGITYTKMFVSSNGGIKLFQENTSVLYFQGKDYGTHTEEEVIVICPWLSNVKANVKNWEDKKRKLFILQWELIQVQFQLQISHNGRITFAYSPLAEKFNYKNIPNGICGIHRFGANPCTIAPLQKKSLGNGSVQLLETAKEDFPCFPHILWAQKHSSLFQNSQFTKLSIQKLLIWTEIPSLHKYLGLYAIQAKDLKFCLHSPHSPQLCRLLEETSESFFPLAQKIFDAMTWDHPEHTPIVEIFLNRLFSENPQRAEKELREHLKRSPPISSIHLPRIEGLCDDWTSQEQLRLWFGLLNGSLAHVAQKNIEKLSKDGTFSALYIVGHSAEIPALQTLRSQLERTLPRALEKATDAMIHNTGQWAPMIRSSDTTSTMLLPLVKKLARNVDDLERMFVQLIRETQAGQGQRVATHLQEVFSILSKSERTECYRIWVSAFIHSEPALQSLGETLLDEAYQQSNEKTSFIHLLSIHLSRKEHYTGMHQRIHSKLISLNPSVDDAFSMRSMWTMLNSSSSIAQEYALQWLMQNHGAQISLKKWIDLASHNLMSVREHAYTMLHKSSISSAKNISETIRLLDSPWDTTYELGCSILRSLKPLEMSTVIQLCDSNIHRVQVFGQELLNEQMTEMAPIAEQLAEHPDIHIEHYVANLIAQSTQKGEDLEIETLIPYFRRVMSRVNASRKTRDEILSLVRHFALACEDNARSLLPTIQWLCCSTVQRDKAHGMETRIFVQEAYPHIEME